MAVVHLSGGSIITASLAKLVAYKAAITGDQEQCTSSISWGVLGLGSFVVDKRSRADVYIPGRKYGYDGRSPATIVQHRRMKDILLENNEQITVAL